jgi:hypothetical protein
MINLIERFRRAIWTFKQPLTLLPSNLGMPVSDLFIWRSLNDWETFFELIDLPALFNGLDNPNHSLTLVIFDSKGQKFLEKTIKIIPGRRSTLALSKLIGLNHGTVGTFSIFHAYTPRELISVGSHIAERGYVSYRFRKSPIRSYVHGNLDAIAISENHSLQLLGGGSILFRKYNLQYSFDKPNKYELGIVNPTPKKQKIDCLVFLKEGKLIESQQIYLPSRGCCLFRITPEYKEQRIVIRSKLIMGRPIVFRFHNETLDVFHG